MTQGGENGVRIGQPQRWHREEVPGPPPSWDASRWHTRITHLTFFCLGVVTTALAVSHRLTLTLVLAAGGVVLLFASLVYHFIRGVDHMHIRHPDYTGDDFFGEEEPGDPPIPIPPGGSGSASPVIPAAVEAPPRPDLQVRHR